MEATYNYAILVANPDPLRGERVNVGIAVFREDRLDLRFSNISKLNALRSHDWVEYSTQVNEMVSSIFYPGQKASEFTERFSLCDSVIGFSQIAWFSAHTLDEYEGRIKGILEALVFRPAAAERKIKVTKINAEITKVFRSANLLAKKSDSLESDHLVHRNYLFSNQQELRADFILKNGYYNVTATLDLRKTRVDLGDAALSAVVLDKAQKHFGKNKTKRWGVYASAIGSAEFKSEIELLSDYSDKAFNWLHPNDRREYTRLIYAGASRPTPLGIN